MQQYTNEITPEINEAQSQPPYDEELLSLCDDKTRKELEEIKKQHLSRPLAHIFRFAVVGSLTVAVESFAMLQAVRLPEDYKLLG